MTLADKLAAALREIQAWVNRNTQDGRATYTTMFPVAEMIGALAVYDAEQAKAGTAQEEIAAERKRQIEVEGWNHEHDNGHKLGELAAAAACYADPVNGKIIPARWPWSGEWWKPKDRRRDLVRAGALIVAEIERLDRAALATQGDRP